MVKRYFIAVRSVDVIYYESKLVAWFATSIYPFNDRIRMVEDQYKVMVF